MAKSVSRLIYTTVTADHYQHYIPLFVYMCRTMTGAAVTVDVRGKLDATTKEALSFFPGYNVVINEDMYAGYPDNPSTTNTLRFLGGPLGFDRVMIMDVDLMIFEDPFPWHEQNLIDQTYCGHRGPQSKPYRPEVSQTGWTGEFERVAGGFFMVTPKWYEMTQPGRDAARQALREGTIGHYRESDEVTLARLIKGAGLSMPESKYFPLGLRGLHMGDFRENMRHRWSSPVKMQRKLSDSNAKKYRDLMLEDRIWVETAEVLRKADPDMKQVMQNIQTHLSQRGVK